MDRQKSLALIWVSQARQSTSNPFFSVAQRPTAAGPFRCSRCKAYVNPWFTWHNHGKEADDCKVCFALEERNILTTKQFLIGGHHFKGHLQLL